MKINILVILTFLSINMFSQVAKVRIEGGKNNLPFEEI